MTAISDPPAKTVGRRDLIGILGTSYAHGGDWHSPIVEVVGRRSFDLDPLSNRQMFSRERDAIEHVLKLARMEAEARLPVLQASMSTRRHRARLWLARNWDGMRRRSTGTLATQAIREETVRTYERILSNRYEPVVKRLPDLIRVPAVIVLDTPVWVVDTSGFPSRPATLIEDRVSHMDFEDVDPSGRFDFRVRYGLARTRGSFLYDHGDTTADEFQVPGNRFKVFLHEEAAVAALAAFHDHVHTMLASSAGHLPMLPAPVAQQALPMPAVPTDETKTPDEQDIAPPDAIAADPEEDEAMKLARIRDVVLRLIRLKPKTPPPPSMESETSPQELPASPPSKSPLQEFASSGLVVRRPPGVSDDLATMALERVGMPPVKDGGHLSP